VPPYVASRPPAAGAHHGTPRTPPSSLGSTRWSAEHRGRSSPPATGAAGRPVGQRCARPLTSGGGTRYGPFEGFRHPAADQEVGTGDEASPNRIPRAARVVRAHAGHLSRSVVSARIGRRGLCRPSNRVGGPIRPAAGPPIAGPRCHESGDGCPDPAFPGHRAASSVVVTSTCSAGVVGRRCRLSRNAWWASVADSVATHTRPPATPASQTGGTGLP
jgi:hypothetical protein